MTEAIEPKPEPLLKRPLDVVVATIGLVLTAPLWPLLVVAVKVQDGGPVFYSQRRWGRGGTVFTVRKFRTMTVGGNAEVRQAMTNDPRITRVGRLLRSTGLDELPQILAILRGDMSLIGPRALAVGEVVTGADGSPVRYEDVPGFSERLRVRPGLSGRATIYLPKDAPATEKFAEDLRYIEQQSFWGDVSLIALSLWISLRGKWEERGSKL